MQIITAAGFAAHATKRKAARMVGIDQLFTDGRRVGKQPQPAERVLALVGAQHARGDRLATDAVETVAAGDVVAGDGVAGAVLGVADDRLGGVDAIEADVGSSGTAT